MPNDNIANTAWDFENMDPAIDKALENFTGKTLDLTGDEPKDDAPGDDGNTPGEGKPPAAKPKEDSLNIDISDDDFINLLEEGMTKKVPVGDKKPAAPTGDTPKPDTSKASTAYQILYDDMVEAGEWEEIEDFDGTPESFQRAKEFNQQKQITEGLKGVIEKAFKFQDKSNIELATNFMNHLAKGGTPQNFIANHSYESYKAEDFAESNPEAEAKATAMLTDYYTRMKWSPAKISGMIAKLKDKGMLTEMALEGLEGYETLRKDEVDQRTQQEETQRNNATASAKAFNDSLRAKIEEGKPVYGVPVPKDPAKRKELMAFMFAPTEETPSGQKVSKLMAKLTELYKNPDWILSQALLEGGFVKRENVEKAIKSEHARTIQQRFDEFSEAQRNKTAGVITGTGEKALEQNSMGFDFNNMEQHMLQ